MALTQKQLAALNACPVMKELKDWFIAIDNEDEPAPIKKYFFVSYGESACTTELGRGTVKTTGVTTSGYIQVQVLSNSSEENEQFVGSKYYVVDTAEPDGTTAYQLYTGAGTGATGMYVKISSTPFPEEETDDD